MNTQSGRTDGIQYGSSSSVSHSHATASPHAPGFRWPTSASTLTARAKKEGEVYVLLGDMNIESSEDETMAALKDAGMFVPDFGATNLGGDKLFDHIAFSGEGTETRLLRKGKFDWRGTVFRPEDVAAYEQIAMDIRSKPDTGKPYANWPSSYPGWTTHEMSDHLPIWIEIEVDYSDEYLAGIKSSG